MNMRKETKMMMQPNCKPVGIVRVYDHNDGCICEHNIYSYDVREVTKQLGRLCGIHMAIFDSNYVLSWLDFSFKYFDVKGLSDWNDVTDIMCDHILDKYPETYELIDD